MNVGELPFVRNIPRDGRAVIVAPYYDHNTHAWQVYAELSPGSIVALRGGIPQSGMYISTSAEDPTRDIELPFATLVTQRMSFPGLHGPLSRIVDDVQNFACVLEKYHIIAARRAAHHNDESYLLSTEVEYLVVVARSLYDLLQLFAKNSTSLVRNQEDPGRRVFGALPDSFADMCIRAEAPRTVDDLVSAYQLTPTMAQFYAEEAAYFLAVRSLRDRITHHGVSLPSIYSMAEGMAINVDESPWRAFDFWKSQPLQKGHFASLRGFIASLVLRSVDLPNRFANRFWENIEFPPAVHPEMRCFLRHPLGRHLQQLGEYCTRPWEGEISTDGA